MHINKPKHASQYAFSPSEYSSFISSIQSQGYQFRLFNDKEIMHASFILLRHDIDIHPRYALSTAEIESNHNVRASYFFQLNSYLYNVFTPEVKEIVYRVHELGHFIGLHFDPRGHSPNILKELKREIEIFTKALPFASSQVVSIHRPSQIGNYTLPFCAEITHTYEQRFFTDIGYYSDSTGEWRYGHPLDSTEFAKRLPMQILIHPVWWMLEGDSTNEKLGNLIESLLENNLAYLQQTIPNVSMLQNIEIPEVIDVLLDLFR